MPPRPPAPHPLGLPISLITAVTVPPQSAHRGPAAHSDVPPAEAAWGPSTGFLHPPCLHRVSDVTPSSLVQLPHCSAQEMVPRGQWHSHGHTES